MSFNHLSTHKIMHDGCSVLKTTTAPYDYPAIFKKIIKMNKMLSLRLISPALLDTSAFSCKTLSHTVTASCRCLSTSVPKSSADNRNIKVNPLFTNRNPRALEYMGLEQKRLGWKYQTPKLNFYHRLVYEKSSTRAYIEHSSGKIVIEAAASEPDVAKYLYTQSDVSAHWNVGRLLARRMLEAGITSVYYDELDADTTSEKKAAFLSALRDNMIELNEPEEIQHEVIPGINYDGYNRFDEERKYQTDYQKLEKE